MVKTGYPGDEGNEARLNDFLHFVERRSFTRNILITTSTIRRGMLRTSGKAEGFYILRSYNVAILP